MRKYDQSAKRNNGQYFTSGNPFVHPAFLEWAAVADLPNKRLLEPFAGSNSIIGHLKRMGLCDRFSSFDINPAHPLVQYQDTLKVFPEGYDVCVTNPPWLARNSATVRGLYYPDTLYGDLYQESLSQCLTNCGFVASLVPESFIRTGLFTDRLTGFVSLTSNLFADTGHPVGLAMFGDQPSPDAEVWSGMTYVGGLRSIKKMRPVPKPDGPQVRFNVEGGNVGLIALDNTIEASIRFCDVRELDYYTVKPSGRHITKLLVDGPVKIGQWNQYLKEFRAATWDVLMTSYKGIRKDGMYRRRLDWQLARGIIHQTQ